MKLSDICMDTEAIEAGAWIGDIPEMPGVELRVRGLDCRASNDMRARLYARRLTNLRMQGVPDGAIEHAMAQPRESDQSRLLIEVILLDWRGLTDEGQPVPYSREVATQMIIESQYRAFRMAVIWAADRVGRSAAALERM